MKTIVPVLCIVYALAVVFLGKFFGMTSNPPTPGGNDVKKSLDEVEADYFKRIVKNGGGQYVGIQECEGHDDLVLFNSPKTGSTLAVKAGACTSDAVATRLALHEDKWSTCNSQRSLESQTVL